MDIEGSLQDLSARGLAIVMRYHLGPRSDDARAEMLSSVRAVVGQIRALDPSENELEDGVLRPVESYLVARHGHEAGTRMNDEFRRAFAALGSPPFRHGRPEGDSSGRSSAPRRQDRGRGEGTADALGELPGS